MVQFGCILMLAGAYLVTLSCARFYDNYPHHETTYEPLASLGFISMILGFGVLHWRLAMFATVLLQACMSWCWIRADVRAFLRRRNDKAGKGSERR
jgi:hypothetical protein